MKLKLTKEQIAEDEARKFVDTWLWENEKRETTHLDWPCNYKADAVQMVLAATEKARATEQERFRERAEGMAMLIVKASVASCDCLTKTNDPRHHDENCRYRMLQNMLTILETARGEQSECATIGLLPNGNPFAIVGLE